MLSLLFFVLTPRLLAGEGFSVFPELFRIGTFEVTSFSLLVAIAALVGIQIFGRELRRSRLPEATVNAAVGGLVGGLVGAKLIWAVEFARTAPFSDLLLSRGGFSWFGGFVGGVGTGLWMLHRYGVGLVPGFSAAAPALAIGHAIGRVGCFLVGDDYGRPSDLPWAVAFPRGLPPTDVRVHPTQLYETLALGILGWLLLRWRASGVPDRVVLSRYLILAGAIRFCIEFVRINARIAGPLTLAQLWSLAVCDWNRPRTPDSPRCARGRRPAAQGWDEGTLRYCDMSFIRWDGVSTLYIASNMSDLRVFRCRRRVSSSSLNRITVASSASPISIV